MPNTVKIEIKALDLLVVKAKLKAITALFNVTELGYVSVRFHGWAITCDRHKDTVFASSGIHVDATTITKNRFYAKVDGEWIYCTPTLDGDNKEPYWYLTFSTDTFIDVR
jgi:hypothetical protein